LMPSIVYAMEGVFFAVLIVVFIFLVPCFLLVVQYVFFFVLIAVVVTQHLSCWLAWKVTLSLTFDIFV
jgi:hypothetical protein